MSNLHHWPQLQCGDSASIAKKVTTKILGRLMNCYQMRCAFCEFIKRATIYKLRRCRTCRIDIWQGATRDATHYSCIGCRITVVPSVGSRDFLVAVYARCEFRITMSLALGDTSERPRVTHRDLLWRKIS